MERIINDKELTRKFKSLIKQKFKINDLKNALESGDISNKNIEKLIKSRKIEKAAIILDILELLVLLSEKNFLVNFELCAINACEYDRLNILKWLFETYYHSAKFDLYQLFVQAIRNGNLSVVKWLRDIIYGFDRGIFTLACTYSQNEIAQWIYDISDIREEFYFQKNFMEVCIQGNLSLAKWIYDIVDVDISGDGEIFILTARAGHLEVLEWLYNIEPDKKKIFQKYFEQAYNESFRNEHFNVSKWIYETNREIIFRDEITSYNYCTIFYTHKIYYQLKLEQMF